MKTHILKDSEYSGDFEKDQTKWKKIECQCGNDQFNVIYTDAYETCAKCTKCGFMDIIHDG